MDKFNKNNAQVFALNPASVTSHQNYCSKKGFTFPILSDPGEKIINKFKSQKPEGKGVLRTVYAFDTEGNVIFAERGMAPFEDVLEAIKANS